MLFIRDPLRPKVTFRLKVRGWRTIYHANGLQKKARVAILLSDNLHFKIKTVTRDEERHYIIIPPRRCNNYKHLYSKCESTQIYKSINHKHKETHS